MAYDGSGNYSLPPGSIVSDGTTIDAADHNVPVTDIAAAMSQVLLRSGVAPMTGDLDLGGHNVINAGVGGGTFLTVADTGTSGHKIPYLDTANTWSAVQTFDSGGVLGNEAADVVTIKGTLVNSYSSTLLGLSSAAAWWTALGINTTASYNIGTSGGTVPLLNAANTWSNTQSITASAGQVTLGLQHPASVSVPNLYSNLTSSEGAGYYQAWFLADGSVVGTITQTEFLGSGSVAYNTSSDDRLKRASTPLVDSGAIIDQLQPIRYRWMRDDGPEDFGFSAQALYAVVPQAVTPGKGEPGDKDFIPWQMAVGRLEAILVAEIQALRARVAALEAALP